MEDCTSWMILKRKYVIFWSFHELWMFIKCWICSGHFPCNVYPRNSNAENLSVIIFTSQLTKLKLKEVKKYFQWHWSTSRGAKTDLTWLWLRSPCFWSSQVRHILSACGLIAVSKMWVWESGSTHVFVCISLNFLHLYILNSVSDTQPLLYL